MLESVLGVVAYDKFGDPHGTGKGQVVHWWVTHKHLFSKHWGELIDLDSGWKELDGDMPELIYNNPQFALSARDAAQMTRSKGTCKGTAPAVGGRAPAAGGRSRGWHRHARLLYTTPSPQAA